MLLRFKVKNIKIVEWLFVLDNDKPDFKLGPCSNALIGLESDEECDGESNEQASKTKRQKKSKAKSQKSKARGCPKSDKLGTWRFGGQGRIGSVTLFVVYIFLRFYVD